MKTKNEFLLGVLPKEEGWKLFKEIAGLEGSGENNEILSVAAEIAEQCAGLPAAIVNVANTLKQKSLLEWKDALQQLKTSCSNKATGIKRALNSSIKLSHEYLESKELQSIISLCAMMDKDAGYLDDVLKWAIGLGAFKGINKIQKARDSFSADVEKLKASSMLLDGRYNDCFNMHEVVRNVVRSMLSKHQNALLVKHDKPAEWSEWSQLANYRLISLDLSDLCEFPPMLDCPRVEFLRICNKDPSLTISEKFFQGMCGVRVLELATLQFKTLPSSITSLKNLQCLRLHQCKIEDASLIGELQSLKILCLGLSDIKQLPHEIKQLVHLQLLDLSVCSKLEVIAPHVLSSLKMLEELLMANTLVRWKNGESCNDGNNASLEELKHLPRLNNLEINIRDAWIMPADLFSDKLERHKIAIGDVWNWTGDYKTARTLKLKLDNKIHLERAGIRKLLRRVEDLYLDELEGVKNALYQLNGEGFPCLKHLLVQNNSEIQYIINSLHQYHAHNAFPMLESLVLNNLVNLEKISNGHLKSTTFCQLKKIKVKNCNILKNLFYNSTVRNLTKLYEVEVSKCRSMEVVFALSNEEEDIKNADSQKIEFPELYSLTLQNLPALVRFYFDKKASVKPKQRKIGISTDIVNELVSDKPLFCEKVSFPNLEILNLLSLNFAKIWHDCPSVCIQNLTTLTVKDCFKLKHLFSYSIARCLVKLKQLEISNCPMMEELVFSEQSTNSSHFSDEVLFPNLETLMLSHMDSLKLMWNDQLAPKYFCKLSTINIKYCKKLVSIFTPQLLVNVQNLETLIVSDCASLNEIFGLEHISIQGAIGMQLKQLCLHRLAQLKYIWNGDPQDMFCFQSLHTVYVTQCESLRHIFPASVAKRLWQLELLHVKECNITEVIAEDLQLTSGIASFIFPKLTKLTLVCLYELRTFYPRNCILDFPMLNTLEVMVCDYIDPFNMKGTDSSWTDESGVDVVPQNALFSTKKAIPHIECIALNGKDAMRMQDGQFPIELLDKLKDLRLYHFKSEQDRVPHWLLERIPSVKNLTIEFSSLRELFPYERPFIKERVSEKIVDLSFLTLWGLPKLEYIWKEGYEVEPLLEKLVEFYVWECPSLMKLMPGSVSFNHLTRMEIKKCDKLVTLLTPSTAKSLVQLITIKVSECKLIEEIIASDGDEDGDLEFPHLKYLELHFLPSLTIFCSLHCGFKFPSLVFLCVKGCPKFKTFSKGATSVPLLHRVQAEETEDDWHWSGTLNATIETLYRNMVALRCFETLELNEYSEIKDIWHRQFPRGSFCNLKTLTIEKCDFFSIVIPLKLLQLLHNLEELKVAQCLLVEEIFDLEGSKAKEWRSIGGTTALQKLTLTDLPRLKHVWNDDPQNFYGFSNLLSVNVSGCVKLEYLFPLSVAKSLEKLEVLHVERCGLEKIVGEDTSVLKPIFVFLRLTTVCLASLPALRCFYPGAHTIEWPVLTNFDVISCDKLEILGTTSRNVQGITTDIASQQPLLSIEKVIPKLEKVSLNSTILMKISHGQIPAECFSNVNFIRMLSFDDEEASFPYWFLQMVPRLKDLVVSSSSFKEIFHSRRSLVDEKPGTSLRLRLLHLWQLHSLINICNDGFQLDPILEFLELLQVWECSSLIYVVPSSASFKHLILLEVSKCHGLLYLMTSSAARRLTQLREIRIKECSKIQTIVCHEVDEGHDIILKQLIFVDLLNLPNLRDFCSSTSALRLPSLLSVILNQCPRMKVFSYGTLSTPKLEKVKVEENLDEYYWEDNLNATVQKLFRDKVGFRKMEHLNISEFPETKDIWSNSLQVRSFNNLKTLVIKDCDFLTTAIPSNFQSVLYNLEELQVEDCQTVEVIFGFEQLEHSVGDSRLKKLTLSSLPELKHVWNRDPKGMYSFHQLKKVSVSRCPNLESVFPLSVAKGLSKLEELEIESSGILEIVKGEQVIDASVNFVFPSLCYLKLCMLEGLRYFYPRRHTLDWPMLEDLDIYICSNINVFSSEIPDFNDSNLNSEVDMPCLFLLEKTLPNFVGLSLNCTEAMMKWLNQCPVDFFSKLNFLRIQFVNEERTSFPYLLLRRLLKLDHLVVKCCSYKVIFPVESIAVKDNLWSRAMNRLENLFGKFFACEDTQVVEHAKIKYLWLVELHNLEYICIQGSQLDPVLQKLEKLYVWDCSLLTKLVPSSVDFTSLVYLEVRKCDGMVFLIKPSTAKSLVHLSTLKIVNCRLIEMIVIRDGLQEVDEIEFSQLKVLELVQLPGLRSFCSMSTFLKFPKLENVTVRGCYMMSTFSAKIPSTRKLEKVRVEETEGEWYWNGDLNATIEKLFNDRMQDEVQTSLQEQYNLALHSLLQHQWQP